MVKDEAQTKTHQTPTPQAVRERVSRVRVAGIAGAGDVVLGAAAGNVVQLILAIDPGPKESGIVLFNGTVWTPEVKENEEILFDVGDKGPFADILAIEMVASYGMPVGADVFETVKWIGRFEQRWRDTHTEPVQMVYRKDVKMHLCGSLRAKDAHIRQRLIDLIGPQGTKKHPGPTYKVKSHAWAALAVAATVARM